jgi:hypothetical protein
MARLMSARVVAALLFAAAALAVPATATAQTRTLTLGKAALAATVVNPCTKAYVSVSGSTILGVLETTDASAALSLSLVSLTNATGSAFSATVTKYSFSESAELSAWSPSPEPLPFAYTVNLLGKGATAADRWILRINVTVAIDVNGKITSASTAPAGTVCIGA